MLLLSESVVRYEGRKLLQAYHCSGSDTVVGTADVSSSIFAMLFVGWLVGLTMGAGLALYLKQKRPRISGGDQKQLSTNASPAATDSRIGWAQNGVRHAKTRSAAIRDEAVRTSGAEGPLGVGLVLQSINFNSGAAEQTHFQFKKPAAELWSDLDLTGKCGQGGIASKPASMALMPLELPAEPYAELVTAKVDATGDKAQAAQGGSALPEVGNPGTIKAAWAGRRSDRSLAGSSLYSSSHTDAMSICEAAAAQSSITLSSITSAGKERPACTPPKPPALPPKVPTATAQRAPGAKISPQAAAAGGNQMPDQAAAHPQSRAAPPIKPVNADNERRKQDEKSKAAAAVAQAYDLDDLDDEWKALLNELEDRLLQNGAQGMDATDRAVAIRSLIVSTAREAPEVALESALRDILRYRKTTT